MKPINELDEAQFKHEMREMYRKVGYEASLRCLFEIVMSANWLCEVLIEEVRREKN